MGRLAFGSATLVLVGACLLDRSAGFDDAVDPVTSGGGEPSTASTAGGIAASGGASTTSAGGEPTTSTGGTGTTGGAGGTGGTSATGGTGGTGGSGGMPTFVVACANGDCNAGQVCCVSTPGNTKNGCADPGTCQGGFEATCDGPDDCPPNQVCCGQWTGSSWSAIGCQTGCDYATGGRIMCDDSNGNCPQAEPSCNESNALAGYFWCD